MGSIARGDYGDCIVVDPEQTYRSAATSGLEGDDVFQITGLQRGDSCGISLGAGSLGSAEICLGGGNGTAISGAIVWDGPIPPENARVKRATKSVKVDEYGYVEAGIGYSIKQDSADGDLYRNLTTDAERCQFIKAHATWSGVMD